jgi:hypothetical protein
LCGGKEPESKNKTNCNRQKKIVIVIMLPNGDDRS